MSVKINSTTNKFTWMFFGLTLIVGMICYTPWVLASYGMFSELLSVSFFLLGGVSPTFAALLTSRIQYGKRGPKLLFKQFVRGGFSKL